MEEVAYQKHRQTASPAGNQKRTLESFIGRRIRIKTVSNQEVEGLIFALDRITNCIAIDCTNDTTPSNKNCSFKLIKLSHIKEFMSIGAEVKEDYFPVGYVNIDRLKTREMEALKGHEHEIAKLGVGVSKEGQDIFNALNKTLPCRWFKDTIVVMDEVLITPPYHLEDCKANAVSSASLARVKKVLEGERKRLQRK
ncbi:anticodon-binding domain-containing protein [Pilobolus umbonatus]|nr:anticodon-binding domain-containing protein [Pilobolus umbonatus]